MAPPMVLPAVATSTAGQNMSGASFTKPKTAGSEPSGQRVAEMTLTTKMAGNPTTGNATSASIQCTAFSRLSSTMGGSLAGLGWRLWGGVGDVLATWEETVEGCAT